MKKLTEYCEWQALQLHHQQIAHHHMRDWFQDDPDRFNRFSLQSGGIFLDYSRNRINNQTLSLFHKLIQAIDLNNKISNLFTGKPINTSEKRPVLHTALRNPSLTSLMVNGENIAPLIQHTREKMRSIVDQIHQQQWKGVTGKPIQHIVNIGIGGSYLGPFMCTQALKDFAISPLSFHFISTTDLTHLKDIWDEINPETTLFIISSKSFSTLETATNFDTISNWMTEKFGHQALQHHFIAITAAPHKALALGIPEEHILPMWDWVGGRYSIWSAIGLPLMLMIGNHQFADFLEGAFEIDQHFLQAEFSKNMPVILALLGIWYINFFGTTAHAIAPYSFRLRSFVSYLQQADMESNGKCINIDGDRISYATGPIIFGEEGCNGQHTYHQLLHQGQHIVPVDFILVGNQSSSILHASGLSQAQALLHGKTDTTTPHQHIPGNRPSNILFLEALTPKNLGALIALYEHKIFVQGVIWQINSFDQWGVELGKQMLPDILQCMQQNSDHPDPATAGMINRVLRSNHA